MNLELIRSTAAVCTDCSLHTGRQNPVFDKGNPKASVFICGMVPAKEENKAGLPFVGRAGQLLDTILSEVGLDLSSVYITNLVKCFVPARMPLEDEWVSACFPYLLAQIHVLSPNKIITLGGDASKALLAEHFTKISAVRGKVFNLNGINIVPTYHPSYLLNSGGQKSPKYKDVIGDFNTIINLL